MLEVNLETRDKLIVALDVSSLEEARRLIDELRDLTGMFKIGLELFAGIGVELFELIEAEKVSIFLDTKFHDIPNTVKGACTNVTRAGVAMLNVHATGGSLMMKAASQATRSRASQLGIEPPMLIAVTVLTSVNETALSDELGVERPLTDHVVRLAQVAKESGLDGVVASAREAKTIRESIAGDFKIVTPGIRPAWSASDDQARIVTPAEALKNGADYLVVGRPITNAGNPKEAALRVLDEMASI